MRTQLATCVNSAELNNSMLCMRGHVSAGFFHCDVLFLQGKHNGFRYIVASA